MTNNSAQVPRDEQPSAKAAVQIWTTPVVQEEAPTSGAEVTIEVTKTNFKAGMRVPGSSTGQMINAATRVLGVVGSVVAPVMVLRFSVDVVMPWYGIWSLVLVAAVLPLVHVVMGNRHDKR